MEKINIITKINIIRAILIIIALFISAIVFNLFLLPLNIVTGGTNGISIITNYLYGIDPSIMIFLISVSCVMISLMYLGKERTIGTLIACVLYPILVKLTANISNIIIMDNSDVLLLVLFASVLSGLANGLMYKSGYSNGGTQVISQVLFETFKIPVAKSSLFINVSIVLVGALFFEKINALYAIIFLYINSLVIDKVLLGISNNKAFYIISNKDDEIKQYIIDYLKHTVTTFEVKGGFLENKRRVMLTVIPTREYYKVTEGIKQIDKEAFFVVTDSYQVEGAK